MGVGKCGRLHPWARQIKCFLGRTMRTGHKIIITGVAIVVAVVLFAVAWLVTPPDEPTCDGRRLTQWMSSLGNLDTDEEAHAIAAIEAIGTNALPVIVPVLGTRNSALQSQFLWLVQRVPFLPLHLTTPADRRQKAKIALFLAGEDSMRASISDLSRLSRDKDRGVRLTAVEVLAVFPSNENAQLPALEAALLDPDAQVRAAALQAVQCRRAVDREVRRLRELYPNPPP